MSIIARSIYKVTVLLILFLISTSSFSKTIFVSLRGSDDYGNGSINMPFQTIPKAISISTPGSTIYIRGGVHNYSSTIKLNKSGTIGNYITIAAYNNETVVLDFAQETYSSAMRGIQIDKGFNYWYLKNLIIKNAGDNGIYIAGNNNIVENCQVSFCKDTGIQITNGGSYNYIHNCDAFDNNDPATGGQNADGIDVKLGGGPGNVLRGCRSYDNADDGFDFYETSNRVVVDSCWAFHNGYNLWNIPAFTGNGNGFKLGGNFVSGFHVVTNCVSFDNTVKGFDQNNNTAGIVLYNCTSFRNGTYNFSFPTSPVDGQDTLMNNISYAALGGGDGTHITSNSVMTTNSWNGFNITNNDFISIDTSLARTFRALDGTLPSTSFLRLNSGSSMIDAGTKIGITYKGLLPDLGAFETNTENSTAQTIVLNGTINNKTVVLNWAVTNEYANTGWVLQRVSQYNYTSNAVWNNLTTTLSQGSANNTLHAYDTIDNLLEYGAYAYRLKQTDLSGVVRYSNVVIINTINNTIPFFTTVSVYPSPFKDVFNINFIIPSPKVIQIALLNSKGQFIANIVNHFYNTRGSVFVPYNGSSLASGVYYLKFLADDGTNSTIPLLKMP